jgi:hypothetical protein
MLSEDVVTIEPFLFIESFAEGKFRMIDGLLIPSAISFAEDGLPEGLIIVDHLIIHEGRKLRLGKLGLGG